jgi:HEAT repeat protein
VTYNTHLRERVVEVVRLVATESPEAAAELTPSLVALLQRQKLSDSLHGTVAGALATITDTRPQETAEHVRAAVEPLAGLSSHERPGVRAQATSLLSYVAQHHPDSLAPVAEQLFDRLDDDHAPVRAAAVWTIAALDTDRARKALARTASTDPDPDVRALAEELHAPDESE